MEKVRPWCGQPSDRGRLKNRTEQNAISRVRHGGAYERVSAGRQTPDQSAALVENKEAVVR